MNKILNIALLGAGAYLLMKGKGETQEQQDTTFEPTTGGETTESEQTEQTETGANVGKLENVKKVDYYLSIYADGVNKFQDNKQALMSAYNAWKSPDNPLQEYAPTLEAFALLLQRKADTRRQVAGIGYLINWDSTPLYDSFNAFVYNLPTWSCEDWIQWHKKLEEHYNNTYTANDVWLQAWNSPEHNPDCWTFGCPDTSYCRYDCDNFVKYLASKDINVSTVISNITCNLQDVVLNVVEGVRGASVAAKSIISILPIALVGYFGYKFLKNEK